MPDAPRWVYRFSDALPVDDATATLDLIGRKGASLRTLAEAGFPVAPGFTITTAACRAYHEHGRWPHGLREQVSEALRLLESGSGHRLGDVASPLTLAVRSGASVSMPGMLKTCLHCGLTIGQAEQIESYEIWEAFETYLSHLHLLPERTVASANNLGSPRDRCRAAARRIDTDGGQPLPGDSYASVAAAITAVFDSWNSASAIRYRNFQGITRLPGTAVTVQAMFPSRIAGVVFTQDPAGTDGQVLRIEALPGPGTSVVGGHDTPVCWQVDRDSLAILNTSSGDASPELRRFAAQQLERLARDCLKIEEMYRAPVDVEWGFADGVMTYFQARPIPAQTARVKIAAVEAVEQAKLTGLCRTGRRYWVASNLGETLPYPTPMTWSLWRNFFTGSGGLGRLYRRLGFRPSRRVCNEGVAELICGRIYVDADRYTELFCAGYPFRFDIDLLRSDPGALERPPGQFDAARLDPWFLLRLPATLITLVRSRRRIRNLSRTAAETFRHEVQTDLAALLERDGQHDLASLRDEELLDLFERRCRLVMDRLAAAAFLPGTLAGGAWSSLERRLEEVLGPDAAPEACRDILATVSNPLIARRQQLLDRLKQDEDARREYLSEFGHRGPDEMELASPRWRELPAILKGQGETHGMKTVSNRTSTDDLRNRLRDILAESGADDLEPRLRPFWETALTLMPYRELGKHEFLRGYALIRDTLQEIGSRLGIGDDVYYLECAELKTSQLDLIPLDEIASRKDERSLLLLSRPASLIDAARPPMIYGQSDGSADTADCESNSKCDCRTLAPGQAAGAALVVRDGILVDRISPEGIIVASTVDPDSLPELSGAAALILERGGVLSHVAILARQFGIPTVVFPDATRRFNDGQSLIVDADSGSIEIRDGRL